MKRTLLLLCAVTAGVFGATVQTAQAGDPVMCKLEQMGVYHSPIGSACHDDPWED